jgi:hypothetical protein
MPSVFTEVVNCSNFSEVKERLGRFTGKVMAASGTSIGLEGCTTLSFSKTLAAIGSLIGDPLKEGQDIIGIY